MKVDSNPSTVPNQAAPSGIAAELGRMIDLPRFTDPRGSLSFVEAGRHIPFDIKRIYYLYDVPAGAARGAHGHKHLEQLIIAIAGSFDIVLDNGKGRQRYSLHEPHRGLYVPRMMWRDLENFSPGAVCMVLASDFYDESDYFRDYGSFLDAISTTQAPA